MAQAENLLLGFSSYTRGSQGSDSRGHGYSQARRQERDTMTHRTVRTGGLIFFLEWESSSFYIFRLLPYNGTSCADGGENHSR